MTALIIEIYIAIMSIAAFAAMWSDKRRARKKRWRIKESTLLSLSLLGGGIGGFIGMKAFRHKTKHIKFKILLPVSAVLWLAILIAFLVPLF